MRTSPCELTACHLKQKIKNYRRCENKNVRKRCQRANIKLKVTNNLTTNSVWFIDS